MRERKEREATHHADIKELEDRYTSALRAEERENRSLYIANMRLQMEIAQLKEELALMRRVRIGAMADQTLPPPYEA